MSTFLILGLVCLVAAIVGGGLDIAKVGKFPVITSVRRHLLLGLIGLGILAIGWMGSRPPRLGHPVPPLVELFPGEVLVGEIVREFPLTPEVPVDIGNADSVFRGTDLKLPPCD